MEKDNSIIEGNKLIAEFMGEKIIPSEDSVRYKDGSEVVIDSVKGWRVCKYHTSWDWLMPVVEKIEKLGYSVFIQNDACWIKVARAGMKMPLISELGENKISAAFIAIVQFIQWYNQTKIKTNE